MGNSVKVGFMQKHWLIFLLWWCLLLQTGIASKCVLNPFYQPVCGSDNKTYGNKDILHCYNKMRPTQRRVVAVHRRECDPLICPSYQDLIGRWPSQSPVCANNGYTYGHVHQVRCLKEFIPSLEVKHEGGCSLFEVRKSLGRNLKKKACAERRRDFERNDICLTNNITYTNPFQAICDRPRLREKSGGRCNCPFQRSCAQAQEIMNTLKTAPEREKNKFVVCGSDYWTYRSRHHLECARRFNSYLYMINVGPCRKVKNPCPDTLKIIMTPTPVCGSDKKSYVSYEALICARLRMNPSLKYLHSGTCVTLPY